MIANPRPRRDDVAVVVIGRNEAEHLGRAIKSIPGDVGGAMYVDSRSTDSSISVAQSMSIGVVALPEGAPLSAALARNAGFAAVTASAPQIRFVQFLDGDCALEPNWLDEGRAALAREPKLAAVWGWRREVQSGRSVFNRICDMEWTLPPAGLTRHFGGDVMIRVDAFQAATGYLPDAIASEDHELSLRLATAGWLIRRLDQPMTTHDAAMSGARQWWRRCVRRGRGYALVWRAHHRRSELLCIGRAVTWAAIVPAGIAAASGLWSPLALLMAAIYPVRVLKIALTSMGDRSMGDRLLWGIHCVASSWPYAWGMARQGIGQLLGRPPRLIEYRRR